MTTTVTTHRFMGRNFTKGEIVHVILAIILLLAAVAAMLFLSLELAFLLIPPGFVLIQRFTGWLTFGALPTTGEPWESRRRRWKGLA